MPDAGSGGVRRRPVYTGVVVVVLALPAGGIVWLFQDELFSPFGDARACEGNTAELPKMISAGGVPLPADDSDVHYATREGTAQVSFLSDRMPDYLHRAGLLPQDAKPFDEQYGSAYALATDEGELPEDLCGPAQGARLELHQQGPGVWSERPRRAVPRRLRPVPLTGPGRGHVRHSLSRSPGGLPSPAGPTRVGRTASSEGPVGVGSAN